VENKSTPISVLGNNKTFLFIMAGIQHSLSIDNRGQAWGWGYNEKGELGNNSINNFSTPVSVFGNHTFCKISSRYHTLAIDKNGKIWSWGSNISGQLGINSDNNFRSTPNSILGHNKTFCYVGTGNWNSFGIDLRGFVWAWGQNYAGSLGDNSFTDRSTPVSIHGANKTFCKICGGYYVTLGIDNNGKIWGWGYNLRGNIGNNSTSNSSTPVSIHGSNKTFCKISVGNLHCLGLDHHGRVWSWGKGNEGALGNNESTDRSTPVSIHGANKTFCGIFCGSEYSFAIDKKGQLWGWGYNYYGQLGTGDINNKSTPVKINF
jgi:alpha-tubulin suppressor-like RCC1 family protein